MQRLVVALLFIITVAAYANAQQNKISDDIGYAGQCTENDHRDYVYPCNTDFNRTWKTCGKNASGNANATTGCLRRHYRELSQECAQCFGNYVGCARSHCLAACWNNPDGTACEACSDSHCQAGLVSCSGIPADQLPLF